MHAHATHIDRARPPAWWPARAGTVGAAASKVHTYARTRTRMHAPMHMHTHTHAYLPSGRPGEVGGCSSSCRFSRDEFRKAAARAAAAAAAWAAPLSGVALPPQAGAAKPGRASGEVAPASAPRALPRSGLLSCPSTPACPTCGCLGMPLRLLVCACVCVHVCVGTVLLCAGRVWVWVSWLLLSGAHARVMVA